MSDEISEEEMNEWESVSNSTSAGALPGTWQHGLMRAIKEIRRLRAEISELELQEQLLLQLSDAYKEERDLLRAENEDEQRRFTELREDHDKYGRYISRFVDTAGLKRNPMPDGTVETIECLIALGKAVEEMPLAAQLRRLEFPSEEERSWRFDVRDQGIFYGKTAQEALLVAKEQTK